MNVVEYIESGILELYLAGTLSEKESEVVTQNIELHPELKNELELIEKSIIKITSALSPSISDQLFDSVLSKLGLTREKAGKLIPMYKKLEYLGWLAMFVCLLGGLIWTQLENNKLQEQAQNLRLKKHDLEQQIVASKLDQQEAEKLIAVLRDQDIISTPLAGQSSFSESYATVYWDKENTAVYLDAQGLPDPPEGMEYQVWSLTLNPLSPTSIGLLSDFTADSDKIFLLLNNNSSEAFGITLEPAGGSESPTMEQLYTLGIIES
ncbi:MAG: anti-sigma factor [Flavobacteriales bacterium]|nr:anti-sigma factor [Flavobacteriales bacterium]